MNSRPEMRILRVPALNRPPLCNSLRGGAMSEVFSFSDVIRQLARSDRSKRYDSREAAMQSLLKSDAAVGSFALLEIVRRIDQVITALDADGKAMKQTPAFSDIDDSREDARQFPGAKIGDLLYEARSLQYGVDTWVVVEACEGGYVKVVPTAPGSYSRIFFVWANNSFHVTLAGAISASAQHDLQYYGRRVKHAEEALAAFQRGEDLSRFVAPLEDEDEDKEDEK
jgi:hypothetical protein